jgi:putative inorganic carbon (hco3(-)) transporter
MFTLLALLLCYSLLTFGAVLPANWFLLGLLWLGVIAVVFVIQTLRRPTMDVSLILPFAFAAVLFAFLPVKLGVSVVALAWAHAATRDSKVSGSVRFLRILVVIGVLEAALGLFQFLVSPGWIFGYVNTAYQVSGTLINRNHFAGLLEMLIPASFGLAYISAGRYGDLARPYMFLLAGAFMGLALLFSVSRMGIFSFLVTVCFLAFVLQLRKSHRRMSTVMAGAMLGMVAAGALWIGVDVIVGRYSDLIGQDALVREGRLVLFRDTALMIRDNPLGVGVGKYEDRFREYQTVRPELLFDHAHNDYLETAAEWGVPAAIVFWVFVISLLFRAVRMFLRVDSPEQQGILLACIGAIFSILVHSLTDFNLQIPSNAMLFFIYAGVAMGMPLPEDSSAARE